MEQKIIDNLDFCIRVAKYLKWKNPNTIMSIKQNTIRAHEKNKRLCSNVSLSGQAHYHNSKPPRICIKQKVLLDKMGGFNHTYENGGRKRGTWVISDGKYNLIELVCHELAHHRTKGHGKRWVNKRNLLMSQMSELIISGDLYRCFI